MHTQRYFVLNLPDAADTIRCALLPLPRMSIIHRQVNVRTTPDGTQIRLSHHPALPCQVHPHLLAHDGLPQFQVQSETYLDSSGKPLQLPRSVSACPTHRVPVVHLLLDMESHR